MSRSLYLEILASPDGHEDIYYTMSEGTLYVCPSAYRENIPYIHDHEWQLMPGGRFNDREEIIIKIKELLADGKL